MRGGYAAAMSCSGASGRAQGDLPERRHPTNALCHVLAGQCRTCDVLDISPEVQILQPFTPVELVAPGGATDFTAMALSIGQDLERPHSTRRINPYCICDHVLPPEDLVHEHVAQQVIAAESLPCTQRAMR